VAYWQHGLEINKPEVIAEVAKPLLIDTVELLQAVAERRFTDKIVPFDDEAYAAGVYNVPTFFIDGERYAEQPTIVLKRAIER
ncbi:DsbA family protein, partial [Acinetobacter baumannii]